MKNKKIVRIIAILLIVGLIIPGMLSMVYGEVKQVTEEDLAVERIISAQGRTFYILEDGRVYGTGSNNNGILGLGLGIMSTNEPMEIPLTGVNDIRATEYATYYVMNNGELYVSGTGLGMGLNYTPSKVEGVTGVKKIVVDGNSAMLLNNAGEVYIFGDNSNGQLGAGSQLTIDFLTKLSGINNVKDVHMGDRYSTILFNDGTVRNAGYDKSGMLGFNEKAGTYVRTHTELEGNNKPYIEQIAGGKDHIMYVSNENDLWVTGAVGSFIGTENSGNNVKTITWVKKFHDKIGSIAVDEIGANLGIATNNSLSFVLLENGELWVVGKDPYAASMDGTAGDEITEYKKVADDVMKFFVGGNQTFIGKTNADLVAAGYNENGEIPGSSSTIVTTPIIVPGMYYIGGTFNKTVTEEEEEAPVGDTLTEEMIDKLLALDFEVIFNVARTGHKDVSKGLRAYQKTLETIEHPQKNKSLERIDKLVDIFGVDFKPYLKYGTYNLYNDYRFLGVE